jgi:signal transduction histidine kinase
VNKTPPLGVILTVEDNPLSRKVVRLALEVEGFAVHEAGDGRAALDYVRDAAPDLILLDIKLPDINGVELVGQLRALPNGKAVPIIAVTGYRSELEHARDAMAGFTEILFKPVEPSLLLRIVRAHLQPLQTSSQHHGVGPRLLLVDDDPVQLKLGALHLTGAGFEVKTAHDGLEGLEQARAWVPQIIVSDVLMPRLDGFRFCAALKQDAALQRIPIVLTSSAFLDFEDATLAREMGAETLIVRTPDYRDVIVAARDALRAPRAQAAIAPDEPRTERYAERTWQQLEQQVRLNASLSQRLAQRRAELAVLAAAADAITANPTGGLQEILQQAFDACGISRGAAYLLAPDGQLTLHAVVGYDETAREGIAAFFGRTDLLRGALDAREPRVIAGAPGGLDAVIVAPLRRGGDTLGLYWMEVDTTDASPADWVPFAAAVASQLAQVIALSQAYAEAAAGREASRQEALRREQLQIKDQFLSHVSHELRTPLTAIHQFVSILLDGLTGELKADQREYLGIALRNVNELRRMIDDLLEATRSETARLSIAIQPVHLPQVINDVVTSLEPSASQKGVTVSVDTGNHVPDAQADPARVGQIISNLLGNAIKFTPEGGSVAVRAQVTPDDADHVHVSVADTGPGVKPDELERIFDYLYQGQNTASLARKGFGIGLHICRDLVVRQGGRIWAESTPGRGSIFHFTLPVATVGSATHAA